VSCKLNSPPRSWAVRLLCCGYGCSKAPEVLHSILHYRIIEWFGLEGTFKGHLVQPPSNEQGHLQLDQVAQSPVQPGLECFQGWGIYHFSGQPIPVFHHPHCKKFLSYVCIYLLLVQNCYPLSYCNKKKSVPSFLMNPPLSTGRLLSGPPRAFSSPD